ncbi:hypothetical protein K431DRAFT_309105 [Polychaeton citri CBS 116435]|uniref:Protein BIG1 n=1 Tax=Polychaeton citri CBS 116435 TaxID=1314669 RepID=A0A9P4QIF6_9PEZI|nr:hypothetical protein K431DRAFT_309105 [Polychaeton citri CBS 116435]
MRSQRLIVATALLGAASAFKDASPFFMLSSDVITQDLPTSVQIDSASNVEAAVKSLVASSCGSYQHFLFLHQDGLTAADFKQSPHVMPHLNKRMARDDKEVSKVEISNVIGSQDALRLQEYVVEACSGFDSKNLKRSATKLEFAQYKSDGGRQETSYYRFAPEQGKEMDKQLAAHDEKVEEILKSFDTAKESWILIYTSSPPASVSIDEGSVYEMDEPYPSSFHQDLKRANPELAQRSDVSAQESLDNLDQNVPLFEKYQYFTPGLFMGLFASFFLLIPVYIGVSALANLEVSYMAFSKEMGPAAQNKGKQS